MTDKDTLLAQAVLGRDAEEFLKSELGIYLLGAAKQEAEDATVRLKTADASDAKLIQRLQSEIWRAESFETWLRELVVSGRSAESALEEHEE